MRSERTLAESVTLAVCIAVLAVIIGLIVFRVPSQDEPPRPVATVDRVEKMVEEFHVRVVVSNDGGSTAADVQVNAELVVDDETTEADQTIDFLAPGDETEIVFVFDDDPGAGELTVAVGGFAIP